MVLRSSFKAQTLVLSFLFIYGPVMCHLQRAVMISVDCWNPQAEMRHEYHEAVSRARRDPLVQVIMGTQK